MEGGYYSLCRNLNIVLLRGVLAEFGDSCLGYYAEVICISVVSGGDATLERGVVIL